MSEEILGLIENEIKRTEEEPLEMNPTYASSQGSIIDLIDYYWVSRYRSTTIDDSGYKKAFFNIVRNPTQVASKMIDLDTKDIRIVAEDGQSYYPAWLFGKDLKFWMKDKNFGKLLNEIVYNWPKYGTVVLKKVKDEIRVVSLQTFYSDPEAETLEDSDYILEVHTLTPPQLRVLAEEKGWKNVEGAIGEADDTNKIKVYERYGDLGKYNFYIVAENETVLDKDTIEPPYKELHWDKIPGRWLGRGRVEDLFENQIAKNVNENLLRQGLRWTSKHLFQTKDDSIANNLMTDVENGRIFTVNSEVTPIAVEERNLGAYNYADAKWDKNTADLSFAHEPMAGERPPAGTPLGTSILQARMAGLFYDLKREDLGLFLKELLFDWVVSIFKKQQNGEHKLMLGEFSEDELDKLRNLIITNRTNKKVLKQIVKGRVPSIEEYEIMRGIVDEQMKKAKDINIPKGFYNDLKYKIDIIITNEQVDMASKLTTLQTVLQILGSNPTILEDKRTKKVFMKLLDMTGISPTEFETESKSLTQIASEQVAQRGGSIARPTPISTPQSGALPTRL